MRKFKLTMRWLCGLLFIAAGINHFRHPHLYESIMPPYLPWPRQLVALSGVLEIGLGGLLLVTQYKVVAAWGLIALLIAVFPANVQMALRPHLYPTVAPLLLWLRLPLQGVLILWVYWFVKDSRQRPELSSSSPSPDFSNPG